MSSDGAFLAAASSIAGRIVADAVWHGDRCNWTGAVVDPALPWRLEYRALEPNLYDGAAGVGLFLAQLAVVNGDGAVRRTARRCAAAGDRARAGAAAGPARRLPRRCLGIAWAAAHAARLLDDEELWAGGRRVAAEAQPPSAPERCPDVITGSAGTILALLALAELYDDPALFENARATGDELIDRARGSREHGWSWADPSRRHRGHLCGLSHGSAGIGWALLELFAATGDERFRTAAEGAFAYERSWFDADSGTWPDLRAGGRRRGAARRFPSPAAGTWCHGEAGIALTRLRASAVLGPATYRDRGGARPRDDAPGARPGATPPSATISRCAMAWPAPPMRCCAGRPRSVGDGRRRRQLGVASIERYGGAPVTGPAGRRAGRRPACSAGSAGSPGGCCGCTTPRSRRRSRCPSAVDTPARAGVGSSKSATDTRNEEVYACPWPRVSIHSSERLSGAPCPVRPAIADAPAPRPTCRSSSRSSGTSAAPSTIPQRRSKWVLVYRDWRMITWLLIEGEGIVHLDTVPEDGDPTRARDVLWVDRDTAVGRGSGPQSDEARFLTGDFTRAGDFDAWETAGGHGRRRALLPHHAAAATAARGRAAERQPAAARNCPRSRA